MDYSLWSKRFEVNFSSIFSVTDMTEVAVGEGLAIAINLHRFLCEATYNETEYSG